MRKCKRTVSSRFKHALPRVRRAGGWQMVELLISLAILGLVSTEVMKGYSQLLTSSTKTQNQVSAAEIAAQVLDNARNQTYAELKAQVGTHTLVVNDMGSSVYDPAFNRPLLLDTKNLVYSPEAQQSRFRADMGDGGSVTETITEDATGCIVNVIVRWKEGSATRSYECSTVISQNGIHN